MTITEASNNTEIPTTEVSSAATAQLNIRRINTEDMLVPIEGVSPLLIHKFGAKAKQIMLDGMQGRKTPKTAKNPEAEYEEAFYRIATASGEKPRYGFPAIAVKSAIVSAARFFGKDVRMTDLRQFMFVSGVLTEADDQPLVEIIGEPRMREDAVRLSRGGSDMRYRPEFFPWSAVVTLTYVKSALTQDSVLSLVDAAGLGVGVGEWRPEKGGDFGRFRVIEGEVTVIS